MRYHDTHPLPVASGFWKGMIFGLAITAATAVFTYLLAMTFKAWFF